MIFADVLGGGNRHRNRGSALPRQRDSIGQVLYHPEAITLAVTPAQTLTAIYDAARRATHQVTGAHAADGQPARWRPHVTICYSTSSQPAKPSISQHCPQCDRGRRVVDVMGRVDAVLGTYGHVVPVEARR